MLPEANPEPRVQVQASYQCDALVAEYGSERGEEGRTSMRMHPGAGHCCGKLGLCPSGDMRETVKKTPEVSQVPSCHAHGSREGYRGKGVALTGCYNENSIPVT